MRPLSTWMLLCLCASPLSAQLTLQNSGSTASLRGIATVDAAGQVAWASGTGGTVLHTVDGGAHWRMCTAPPGADKLDFRAVQAFSAQSALVMSSGEGAQSKLYRTTDGCNTWKLVFTNPDAPGGFFDALQMTSESEGWLLGDPVKGVFYLANTTDGGETWTRVQSADLNVPAVPDATHQIGAFAGSNQSLTFTQEGPLFGGGEGYAYRGTWAGCSQSSAYNDPGACLARMPFDRLHLPLANGNAASGMFAVASTSHAVVAVGGDYTSPDAPQRTAAFSRDGGHTWQASSQPPHGYRSTVAYSVEAHAWLAAGPNGMDVSIDDGDHWLPLRFDASLGNTSDADRNWNALSLPFVVGSHGRIARIRTDALRLAPRGAQRHTPR